MDNRSPGPEPEPVQFQGRLHRPQPKENTVPILLSAALRNSGGARHRRKGSAIEREIVHRHRDLGVRAERYPLSGASRFRGSGHDLDIYLFGRDEAPLISEVKARKSGSGFTTLEKWLGTYDILFLRRNSADPLIVLPWRVYAQLLERVRR
jgi:Holliday junction resolvase